jgi:hypothetical protein
MKKNAIRSLEASVQSNRNAQDEISCEQYRIVEEFKKLLVWIEAHLPREIHLPLGSIDRDRGIFQCEFSDHDLELYYRDPGSSLSSEDMRVVVQIVERGFVKNLRRAIKSDTSEKNGELSRVRKISVPAFP